MQPSHSQVQQTQLYRTFQEIIRDIMSRENAFFFFRPVDPIADGAPDYFLYICNPMSILTVQEKLDRTEYKTADEFIRDIRLIWSNAKIYNHHSHPIYKTADALAVRFEIFAAGLPHEIPIADQSSALQRLVELRFACYRAAKQTHK
jgi:hypothetical protein